MPIHPDRSFRTTTRRAVVRGGGFAVAASLAGLSGTWQARAQIDATPPAAPVSASIEARPESVADVAAWLEYDLDAMVAFVRDEIRYEPYEGVLRGANGTLRSRSGNSADTALLLAELFAASHIPCRFAFGPLGPAHEQAMLDSLQREAGEVAGRYIDATEAALLHQLGVPSLEDIDDDDQLTPDEQASVDAATESSATAYEAGLAAQDASMTVILDALDAHGIDLPPLPAPSLPPMERSRHAWVQIPDGPDWYDLDPTIPDAGNLDAIEAVETVDTLPDDLHHRVRLAISADILAGTTLQRQTLLEFSGNAEDAGESPLAIGFSPNDAFTDLGYQIQEIVSGQVTVRPWMVASGELVPASTAMTFTTDAESAESVFGGGSGAIPDGEALAVWLGVDVIDPTGTVTSIERALMDRVAIEDRQAGMVDPSRVEPVSTGSDGTVGSLDAMVIVHAEVASTPPAAMTARSADNDEIVNLGAHLTGSRDRLMLDIERAAGSWSFPSGPNLTAFHLRPDDAEGTVSIDADLLHRARTSLPITGSVPDPAVHPLVLSGVLDAAAEVVAVFPDAAGTPGPSIDAVFTLAIEAGHDIRLVTATGELASLDIDPVSRQSLTESLEAGLMAIVPEAPVELGGESILGWWLIDPTTGRTSDRLSNLRSGASARFRNLPAFALSPMGEYAFLKKWVTCTVLTFLLFRKLINIAGTASIVAQAGDILDGNEPRKDSLVMANKKLLNATALALAGLVCVATARQAPPASSDPKTT